MEGYWQIITRIAELIIALAAATAVLFAWKSTKETRKASLAQILMQITDAYSSPEMLAGMLRLHSFKERFQENFGGVFAQLRENNYKDIKEIDEARRRYSHHFYKIWLLFDRGLVNKKFVKKVATHGQVDFLLETIEPLEKAIDPDYDHSTFDFFREIYPEES